MPGQLAESGDFALVGIAVEALIIFVGQPDDAMRVEIVLRRAIGEIDGAPLVVKKETRDPFERPVAARHEPRFLPEQNVIALGVKREGKSLALGYPKVATKRNRKS